MKDDIIPMSIRPKTPNLIIHLGDVQKASVSPGKRLSPQISGVGEKEM